MHHAEDRIRGYGLKQINKNEFKKSYFVLNKKTKTLTISENVTSMKVETVA